MWSLGYEDPTSGRGRGGEDDVEGDADVGVAQPFRHDLRIDSSRQLQGCVGVTQTVEGQVGQIIWFGEGLLHKSNI